MAQARFLLCVIHRPGQNFRSGWDVPPLADASLSLMKAVHGTLTPLPLHTPAVTSNLTVYAPSGFIQNIIPTVDSYPFRP